jgi:type IV pilus assembly protein PilB
MRRGTRELRRACTRVREGARQAAPRKRLGERLLDAGLVTELQLEEALTRQQRTGEILGRALLALGHVAEDDLVRVLCAESGIAYLSGSDLVAEPAAVHAVPESLARTHTALPLREADGRLVVAMGNPFDISAVTSLERAARRPLKVVAASREALALRITEAYGEGGAARRPVVEGLPLPRPAMVSLPALRVEAGAENSSTAAQLCDEIIRRGISLGATDIHVEPQEDSTRVRYRLDGLLHEGGTFPRAVHPALMSRFKILSELNIAESRLPQDGRFRIRAEGREIDLRISTFPTMHGEDVVMRILDRGRVALNLDDLGIAAEDVALFRGALARPHGLIAVTGPTGSGKTTTLYSGLTELNRTDRCVITLEDPIEYELAGVRQAQINVKAGLTFGSGLRSILRHDPDIILVGEMRDAETVQIALSAALTGHLVLTTLHTNTAAGAVPRLLDMGAEAFLLASAIQLVVSQRLVRKLCMECRALAQLPDGARTRFGLDGVRVYEPRGCAACRQTGFRGRIGIFEFLPITGDVSARILVQASEDELRAQARRPMLLDDGLRKVKAGLTSLDELLRVIVV